MGVCEFFSVPRWRIFENSFYIAVVIRPGDSLRRSDGSRDVARLIHLVVAAAVLLVVLLLRVGLGSKILEPCFLFDLADILTSRIRSLQPLPRNPLLQHRLKR